MQSQAVGEGVLHELGYSVYRAMVALSDQEVCYEKSIPWF